MTQIAPKILGEAFTTYQKLPRQMQIDIEDWLEDRPHKMLCTKNDVMEAWLEWNGIIGYDEDFRNLFKAMM